jgi:threonine dehydrogenase-like Zn-dependent dehydrogenase
MRQLVFHGPGHLAVHEAPEPPLGPEEVRIVPHAVGICGSDVHGFTGANQRRVPGIVMGHEAAGTVVERGGAVLAPELGARVAINPAVTCGECEFCLSGEDHRCPQRRLYGCVLDLPGAFADSIVVRAANGVPFDGPAPLDWGALVEPFAVGYHGVNLLGGDVERGVLVLGGGPIGLGAALAARRKGVARVVVAEPVAHRRAVAHALDLETFDPQSAFQPEPFDAAVECVAAPATLEMALRLTLPGAEVAVVGLGELQIPLPIEPLVVGERSLKGSFNYTRRDFAATAAWVASGEIDLNSVIEARVELEGLIDAFRGYARGTNHTMKTLFQPSRCDGQQANSHSAVPRRGI